MDAGNSGTTEQVKPDAIVAGIINTRTGEISDTITSTAGKVRLFLKVRDELNVQHGKNAFMVFEFNSACSGNIDYVKRNMQTEATDRMSMLYLLQVRYNIQETERALIRLKGELSLIQETMSECLRCVGDHPKKREIIEDALTEEVRGTELEIESLLGKLSFQKKKEKALVASCGE